MPAQTLTRRQDFVRVQSQGHKLRGRHMLLILAPTPDLQPQPPQARLGFTVSRKVGNAVVRNRVRRRLKAISHDADNLWSQAHDHVVVAFPMAASMSFGQMHDELLCLLRKANQWVQSPERCGRSSASTV